MIDVKRYIEKKQKGLATLAKVGNAYAISYKRFDPETGETLDDEVVAVDIDDLNKQKEELQKQIDDINAMLKDIDALK